MAGINKEPLTIPVSGSLDSGRRDLNPRPLEPHLATRHFDMQLFPCNSATRRIAPFAQIGINRSSLGLFAAICCKIIDRIHGTGNRRFPDTLLRANTLLSRRPPGPALD